MADVPPLIAELVIDWILDAYAEPRNWFWSEVCAVMNLKLWTPAHTLGDESRCGLCISKANALNAAADVLEARTMLIGLLKLAHRISERASRRIRMLYSDINPCARDFIQGAARRIDFETPRLDAACDWAKCPRLVHKAPGYSSITGTGYALEFDEFA